MIDGDALPLLRAGALEVKRAGMWAAEALAEREDKASTVSSFHADSILS